MDYVLAVEVLQARANLMHEPLCNRLWQPAPLSQIALEVASCTVFENQVVVFIALHEVKEAHYVLVVKDRRNLDLFLEGFLASGAQFLD